MSPGNGHSQEGGYCNKKPLKDIDWKYLIKEAQETEPVSQWVTRYWAVLKNGRKGRPQANKWEILSTHEMVAHTALCRVESHPREGSESMDEMGWDKLWSMLSPLQKLTPIKTLWTAKALTSLYLTKEILLPRDLTDIWKLPTMTILGAAVMEKVKRELRMLSSVTLYCQVTKVVMHALRFSIVRIVISVSNVSSLKNSPQLSSFQQL